MSIIWNHKQYLILPKLKNIKNISFGDSFPQMYKVKRVCAKLKGLGLANQSGFNSNLDSEIAVRICTTWNSNDEFGHQFKSSLLIKSNYFWL